MNASRRTRILLAVSAVLFGLTLWLPLWRVSLLAPQYPEGIGMRIWAHTVSGVEPNDLQNINGLNHYIGMHIIEPESIPELKYMPWGIGAMALAGLLLAAWGRRRLMALWAIALLVAGCVGLADFWKWEYDYGHNLDLENAPIKIPGMAYQPPLIGTKQLLNFTATSLPDSGGWMAIVAVVLGIASIFLGRRDSRSGETQTGAKRNGATVAGAAAVVALSVIACQDRPRDVLTNADACAYCRMTVDDPRFAGQVMTSHGKIETFDSIECLASYVVTLPATAPPRGVWVSDAQHPGTWIPATSARFVRDGSLHSPMGRKLAAFAGARPAAELQATYGGQQLGWPAVQEMMRAALRDTSALNTMQHADSHLADSHLADSHLAEH